MSTTIVEKEFRAETVITESQFSPNSYLDLYLRYAKSRLPGVHADYHLLVGLAVQAALLGHNLVTDTGLQTNIAGVIVTVQGIGKSATTGKRFNYNYATREKI